MLVKTRKNVQEIDFKLNNYNHIYSSFDPRHYSERALSSNFLAEAKRASRDKDFGKLKLELFIPKKKRNRHTESVIQARLKEHFNKHYARIKKEKSEIIKNGFIFILIGIFTMLVTTWILFSKGPESLFINNFFIILLEPAGWFLFWEGLNLLLFEADKNDLDLFFYKKMTKCNIDFLSY